VNDTARGICKTMAVRALHTGRLGSALHWGIGSKVTHHQYLVKLKN